MKKSSVFHKLNLNPNKKNQSDYADCQPDSECRGKGVNHTNDIKDGFVAFNAKFLGFVEVTQPKGVEMVKESIKKLKIARQLKKAEQGHKGSKLPKVEIVITIDTIKVVELKNKNMICARPLQRVSYCADDHRDKKLFAFIAKEQETKSHKCFVFVSEKEASEITLTLGQAFQLAYKRYMEKERADIKANKDSINIEKQITKLKEENEKLKHELESNKGQQKEPRSSTWSDSSSSIINNSAFRSGATSPMEPSLSTASCIIGSPTQINDISFDVDFNPADESYDTSINDGKIVDMDIFGTLDHVPTDDEFCVKVDPFADTPDWQSVASDESLHQQPLNQSNPFVETAPTNHVHEPSHNPFVVGVSLGNDVNHDINNDLSLDENILHEQNSDLFSNYLSNVVAQRTYSDAAVNYSGKTDFSHERNNNHISIDSNLDQYSDQFSANNEFGFQKLDITDSSGNVMNEFHETDDGFFTDPGFTQRPKAHTITVLTGQTLPRFKSNEEKMSSNTINEVDEDEMFSQHNLQLQKTKSCGAAYNQIRPRPNSISIPNHMLPAPPTKQSIKKQTCIKTPTLKVLSSSPLSSTPLKESTLFSTPLKENTGSRTAPVTPEIKEKSSSSFVLPNVKNSTPLSGGLDLRPRSRSRVATFDGTPLRESISQASKSLEDLTR